MTGGGTGGATGGVLDDTDGVGCPSCVLVPWLPSSRGCPSIGSAPPSLMMLSAKSASSASAHSSKLARKPLRGVELRPSVVRARGLEPRRGDVLEPRRGDMLEPRAKAPRLPRSPRGDGDGALVGFGDQSAGMVSDDLNADIGKKLPMALAGLLERERAPGGLCGSGCPSWLSATK